MNLLEKYASRLKADRERFMERQSARLRQMGVDPAFTVSSDHVRAIDQKPYNRRDEPSIVYGEWTVKEVDGQVIVTRTEYGYLK